MGGGVREGGRRGGRRGEGRVVCHRHGTIRRITLSGASLCGPIIMFH